MRLLIYIYSSIMLCPSLALAANESKMTLFEKIIGFVIAWILMDIAFSLLIKK